MRSLALFAVAYLLAAALVLPTSLSASQPAAPGDTGSAAGEGGAPAADPAAQQEPGSEPAPAAQPEPAPAQDPAPAQSPEQAAQPAAEPAPPADEAQGDAAPAATLVDTSAKKKRKGTAQAAASTTVTIKDFEFGPASVTVNVGDTVTWHNNGPTAHSATARDGSFDTGIFSKGGSRSHTFDRAGTFSYICTPHPFMKGTITVQASSSGGSGGGSAPGGSSGSRSSGDTSGGSTSSSSSSSSSSSDSGSTLPVTGSDLGSLLSVGLLLIGLGAVLARRTRAADPPPAGRIGW